MSLWLAPAILVVAHCADFVVHSLVLAKFTQTIVRCRPITQIGAEQVSPAAFLSARKSLRF